MSVPVEEINRRRQVGQKAWVIHKMLVLKGTIANFLDDDTRLHLASLPQDMEIVRRTSSPFDTVYQTTKHFDDVQEILAYCGIDMRYTQRKRENGSRMVRITLSRMCDDCYNHLVENNVFVRDAIVEQPPQ
jgi:hypothetical protein